MYMNGAAIVRPSAHIGLRSKDMFERKLLDSPTAEGAMKALAHTAHRARKTAVNFMVRFAGACLEMVPLKMSRVLLVSCTL